MKTCVRLLFGLVAAELSCATSLGQVVGADLYGDPLPAHALARIGTLRFRTLWPATIDISPDGTLIAGAGWSNPLHIWDARSGRVIYHGPRREFINSICFSQDGKTLFAAGDDGEVRFFNTQTWGVERKVAFGDTLITAIAVSPDGKTLALVAEGLRVWDIKANRPLREFDFGARRIAYSRDGKMFAADMGDGGIVAWDGGIRNEPRRFKITGGCKGFGFSPDGRYFGAACRGRSVEVWDIATGKLRRTIQLENLAFSCCFSADSRFLAAMTIGRTLSLFDLASGEPIRKATADRYMVTALFSPDGRFLAAKEGLRIQVWNLAQMKLITDYPTNPQSIFDVRVLDEGRTVASACSDGLIRYWQSGTGRLMRKQALAEALAPNGLADMIALSGSGRIVATGDRHGVVRLADARSMKQVETFAGPDGFIQKVVFSPDERSLVSVTDGEVATLWARAAPGGTGEVLARVPETLSAAFSPNGKLLALGRDPGGITLCNARSGEQIRTLMSNGDPVLALAFASDGQSLVSGGLHGLVCVWDIATGKERCRAPLVDDPEGLIVRSVAYAPSGKSVAYGASDAVVRIVSTSTGKVLRQLEGHDAEVTVLSYFDGGRKLASASDDGTVVVWDVSNP